jgi:hypothetical protein
MSERQVWTIRVIIEATREQAEEAQEAIARALCPDEHHPGYGPVPWTLIVTAFDDLDADEKAAWQAQFDEDRKRERDVRETGT